MWLMNQGSLTKQVVWDLDESDSLHDGGGEKKKKMKIARGTSTNNIPS